MVDFLMTTKLYILVTVNDFTMCFLLLHVKYSSAITIIHCLQYIIVMADEYFPKCG